MAGPAAPPLPAAAQGRCVLRHPVFTQFGEVVFRAAEADGAPVMIFPLGGSTAAIPLASLQHEFQIGADSPDGQTLGLVVRALDFVGELRPGDALPLEVLDGGASWQPGAQHARVAEQRLRLQLAGAFGPSPGTTPGMAPGMAPGPSWAGAPPQAVLSAAADPALDARLQSAAVAAAAALRLPNATAVSRLLADAAHELGYMEALRDRLLRRVGVVLARVDGLGAGLGHNPGAAELLSRVRRLAGIAYERMRARFVEMDGCTAEVLQVLRDLDGWRCTVRRHRDWLYSSLRAWEGILMAWEGGGLAWSLDTWALLRRTYRFLAPRFMPMHEWQGVTRAHRADAGPREPMVW